MTPLVCIVHPKAKKDLQTCSRLLLRKFVNPTSFGLPERLQSSSDSMLKVGKTLVCCRAHLGLSSGSRKKSSRASLPQQSEKSKRESETNQNNQEIVDFDSSSTLNFRNPKAEKPREVIFGFFFVTLGPNFPPK